MTSLLRMSRDIKSEVCAGKLKNRSKPTLAKISVLVVRKDLGLLAFIVFFVYCLGFSLVFAWLQLFLLFLGVCVCLVGWVGVVREGEQRAKEVGKGA